MQLIAVFLLIMKSPIIACLSTIQSFQCSSKALPSKLSIMSMKPTTILLQDVPQFYLVYSSISLSYCSDLISHSDSTLISSRDPYCRIKNCANIRRMWCAIILEFHELARWIYVSVFGLFAIVNSILNSKISDLIKKSHMHQVPCISRQCDDQHYEVSH